MTIVKAPNLTADFWMIVRRDGTEAFVGFNDGNPSWSKRGYHQGACFVSEQAASECVERIRRRERERRQLRQQQRD